VKTDVIFFWLPKVAGTSIYGMLEPLGCPKLKHSHLYNNFNNEGFVTFGHISVPYLLKKGVISKEYFNKSYKFCFVRNPWDRLVSYYFHLGFEKKMTFEEFCVTVHEGIKLQKTMVGSLFNLLYRIPWVGKALSKVHKVGPFYLPIPQIGPYNSLGLSPASPQIDWIKGDNGKIIVDFIGKFENLEDDLLKVSRILGASINDLPHLNSTSHQSYKTYYTEKTKRIVEQTYAEEIDLFEYTF